MKKFLIYALMFFFVLGFTPTANSHEETGLGVQVETPVMTPPTYRERLDQMASRGQIRRLDVVVTAYDLSYGSCEKYPSDPAYGITASGEPVREGVIAVDPKVIPLHSKGVLITEDGQEFEVVAKDTGSAIKGNKIDKYIDDSEEVWEWGVKQGKLYILKEGK